MRCFKELTLDPPQEQSICETLTSVYKGDKQIFERDASLVVVSINPYKSIVIG